jgi:hypothetical protein
MNDLSWTTSSALSEWIVTCSPIFCRTSSKEGFISAVVIGFS